MRGSGVGGGGSERASEIAKERPAPNKRAVGVAKAKDKPQREESPLPPLYVLLRRRRLL